MTTENIKQVIHQPEGRRLEFKVQLSANSDIAKAIVAFANDAGDDIYKIADQIVELQKIAILQYTPIVDNIIRRKERDIDEICRTLDYVLDFAGTDDGLALFKRLCAYLYTVDQQVAVDYVELYKDHYERDDMFKE